MPEQAAATSARAGHTRAVRRLLAMLGPYRYQILCAFSGMATIAATEPALVWFIKEVVDGSFSGRPANSLWLIVPAFLIGLFAVRGAAAFWTGYAMIWVSSNVLVSLQKQAYNALLSADPRHHRDFSGKIVNAIVAEGRNATELVERVIIKFFRSLFSVLALLVYLFHLNWKLACVTTLFALPFVLVVRLTGKRYEAAAASYVSANSTLAEHTEEAIGARSLVKSYCAQAHERSRFEVLSGAVNRAFRRMSSLAGLLVPSTQCIGACLLALLIEVRPLLGTEITPGEYVAFISNILLMLVPLRDLAEVNGAMLRGLVGAFTVFSVVDVPQERAGGLAVPRTGPGRIDLHDVTLNYTSGCRAALTKVSLSVHPGETLALLGRSGSGKSSLVKIITRLCAPSAGSVSIDGRSADAFDLAQFRSTLAVVEQETLLFEGTIAANVAYGAPRPDVGRVREALEQAQLGDFISALPHGLDTRVGRNGEQLSGGQRQLLSIARAFYKNCPILILDEPTSSLDAHSEQRVKAALQRLAAGRTTIIVTHRLAMLDLADRYLVLDQGRIASSGQVAALLAVGREAGSHPSSAPVFSV